MLIVYGAGSGYDQDIILLKVFLDDDLHVIDPLRFGFLCTPRPKNGSPAIQANVYVVFGN
jgi:hypothetical protein